VAHLKIEDLYATIEFVMRECHHEMFLAADVPDTLINFALPRKFKFWRLLPFSSQQIVEQHS